MSKNLDETVRPRSEKREEWIREIRGETPQEIAEGASSAPRLANSSAAWFAGRNGCPGTHCSLIKREEREDSSCQIRHIVSGKRKNGGEDRVTRAVRKSNRRRRDQNWQTCWCCRDQQRARRMAQASAEKLDILGLLRRKEWSQCHRESRWQVFGSRLCQKVKEKCHLSRAPDHEGGESQGEREPHLGEREGDQSESIERKGWTPQ